MAAVSEKRLPSEKKFKVTGGTIVCIIRPTTAFPAHNSGANTSKKIVPGVSL